MINILFFIANYNYSKGEITNAKYLYEQLPKDRYNCYFTGNNEVKDYITNLNINYIELEKIYDKNWDIIIISDYHPFLSKLLSNNLSKEEENAYKYILLNLNCPLLVIDILKFHNSIYIKDIQTRCLVNKLCLKEYKPQICKPLICEPRKVYFLFPSPPHAPNDTQIPNYKYFKIPILVKDKNFDIRKELNLRDDSKIIFMAITKWQYYKFHKDGNLIYYLILEKLLTHYLLKLNKNIDFIVVSPAIFHFDYSIKNLKVKYIKLVNDLIDPKKYEQIFLNSDLIITDNIIQNTSLHSLLNGIPIINIVSDLPIKQINQNKYKIIPNFPLTSFTKELLYLMDKNSPYLVSNINTVRLKNIFKFNKKFNKYQELLLSLSVELFDENRFVELIYKYLYDKNYIDNLKQIIEEYKKDINNLPNPSEYIENILYFNS